MGNSRRMRAGLALIVGLWALLPLLSGCHKEEPNDPNYYTGKDFKRPGPAPNGQTVTHRKND